MYDWLVFSHVKKGYYCKYCTIFVNNNLSGGQKTVPLKHLVTEPLTSFKRLFGLKTGYLTKHNLNKYHLEAVERAKDFLEMYENPEKCIENKINTLRLQQIEENRRCLKLIIQTVLLLGRQNIAFRGHRDDGNFNKEESFEESTVNMGNFRAILDYRSEFDGILKEHLKNSSSRAKFTSKTIQNELIDCAKEVLLSQIISEIKLARFFSIMFDECTDSSNISQLSLVLRYVYNGKINEQFIEFIDVRREMNLSDDPEEDLIDVEINEEQIKLTGKKIGNVILQKIADLGLDILDCVGITTDGCTTMVSEVRGAVSVILDKAVNAIYSPCYNHALNLVISQSSKVQAIRNAVSSMQETTFFLNASSKRSALLKKKFKKSLSNLCETRWVERHDAVLQFRYCLPNIVQILNSISKWKDRDASLKAQGLLKNLTNSTTIVAIIALSDLLTCTKGLSEFLQGTDVDLKAADDEKKNTIKMLERRRTFSLEYFQAIFSESKGVAEELGIEITVPRVAGRQVHRENYSTADIESYYRQSIYIPALDSMTADLEARFSKKNLDIYNFLILYPQDYNNVNNGNIKNLVKKYEYFLDHSHDRVVKELCIELERWNDKWTEESSTDFLGAIDFLEKCNSHIYPRIAFFLKIVATLPVSNASPERTFSSLRRLKTWLRSTMNQNRLTGLALLHIHRSRKVDSNDILNVFAKTKNRRINLIL